MTDRERVPVRWWRVGLGLLLLHVLAVYHYTWENAELIDWLRPSPDLLLALAVGVALVLRFGYRTWIGLLVALGLVLVPLYRFGHTVMPVFWGKEFDPYNDLLAVPGLIHLLTHDLDSTQRWMWFAGCGLAALLIFCLAYFATRAVLRASSRTGWTIALLAAGQLAVVATIAERSVRPPPTLLAKSMYGEALRGAVEMVRTWHLTHKLAERIAIAEQDRARASGDLAGLQGVDVYLLFIESYGRALFRQPQTAAEFSSWMPELEGKLERAGFDARSAFGFPSISGGASALAHTELLCGVEVRNRRIFDMLLASNLKALPKYFADAGYYTAQVQPATTEDWPEGKFLGFEEDIFFHQLPYQGTTFHWGVMPDQFALDHVLRTRILPNERPVFVQFVSVTCHAPFSTVPYYYEDWGRVAAPEAFPKPLRTYPITWTNYAGNPQVSDAYMDVVLYSLRTVVGFAEQLERPSLLLVLGDHQPPAVGNLMDKDTSRDVPFHVIANREELLAPFLAYGFAQGLDPPKDYVSFPTSEFLVPFLQAFSTPPETTDR